MQTPLQIEKSLDLEGNDPEQTFDQLDPLFGALDLGDRHYYNHKLRT